MDPRKSDGTPWSASDTGRMHQWFAGEAQKQMRQRDHDLFGIPLDGRVNQPVKRGTTTEWVVNLEWSKNKHSSADWRALQEKLWTAFCSEPRDPDAELAKIGLAHQEDQLPPGAAAMKAAIGPLVAQNQTLIEQNRQLLEALHATHNGKGEVSPAQAPRGLRSPSALERRQRDVSPSPSALERRQRDVSPSPSALERVTG